MCECVCVYERQTDVNWNRFTKTVSQRSKMKSFNRKKENNKLVTFKFTTQMNLTKIFKAIFSRTNYFYLKVIRIVKCNIFIFIVLFINILVLKLIHTLFIFQSRKVLALNTMALLKFSSITSVSTPCSIFELNFTF